MSMSKREIRDSSRSMDNRVGRSIDLDQNRFGLLCALFGFHGLSFSLSWGRSITAAAAAARPIPTSQPIDEN